MKIIANPWAGHGRGASNLERLQQIIRRRGFDCELVLTERPGHATELARQLAEAGEPRIAIMGGDGTIGEVVDGIVGSDVEIGVISTGTGNDVARSLGLPLNDLERGLEIAFEGSPRLVDVGRERDRHFISVLGLVFPAVVAAQANSITRLHGSVAFFVAVYRALYRLRAVPLEIELDDQTLQLKSAAVLIQNTPYTGGGMRMAPEAKIDDGLLDVVVVSDIGKLDLMVSFPRAYSGRHLQHRRFALYRSSRVSVRSPESLPKMFDGDICGETPVEADTIRGGVKLITSGESHA